MNKGSKKLKRVTKRYCDPVYRLYCVLVGFVLTVVISGSVMSVGWLLWSLGVPVSAFEMNDALMLNLGMVENFEFPVAGAFVNDFVYSILPDSVVLPEVSMFMEQPEVIVEPVVPEVIVEPEVFVEPEIIIDPPIISEHLVIADETSVPEITTNPPIISEHFTIADETSEIPEVPVVPEVALSVEETPVEQDDVVSEVSDLPELTDEFLSLCAMIHYEAGEGASLESKVAVGKVVMNRLACTDKWGYSNLHDVLYAKGQFSVVNTKSFNSMKEKLKTGDWDEYMQSSVMAAQLVYTDSDLYDIPEDVCYFYGDKDKRSWANHTYCFTVGGNSFFK